MGSCHDGSFADFSLSCFADLKNELAVSKITEMDTRLAPKQRKSNQQYFLNIQSPIVQKPFFN